MPRGSPRASSNVESKDLTLLYPLVYVAWIARGNHERTYRVLATTDASQPYATVLFSNTLAGGTAPWYAVTNTLAEAGTNSALYYAVEVKP